VIASVLGALVTLAAEHGTQAQNVQHVSWVLPAISGPTLSKLAATEENLRDLDTDHFRHADVNSLAAVDDRERDPV
jgi:hypothetical protein